MTADEAVIWPALADLFFLDTEPQPESYRRTAALLKARGWKRPQTERTLLELIAPVAGGNLGYLVYPVIGEWAGFDPVWLNPRIEAHRQRRARWPRFRVRVSDFWCRRMLQQLEWQRLLDLLD